MTEPQKNQLIEVDLNNILDNKPNNENINTKITNMENSVDDKFKTQIVGSAIQFNKGTDNEYYRCVFYKSDLGNCTAYPAKNRLTGEIDMVHRLSFKKIKDPHSSATHMIVDSLYHKSKIVDQYVEVSARVGQNKLLAKEAVNNELHATFSLQKESFNGSDFRGYFTPAKGEKVRQEDYIGYANRVDRQKDIKNNKPYDHKIIRDFIGSAYINENEKFKDGQTLNLSVKKDDLLKGLSEDQKHVYVNLIQVKNSDIRLAAYVSNDKADKAQNLTFRLEPKDVRELTENKEGYVKLFAHFDDTITNKNYNISIKEFLNAEQREKGIEPKLIGYGADREHIAKWHKPDLDHKVENTQQNKTQKPLKDENSKKQDPTIPSVDDIRGKKTDKSKGLEM